MICTNMYMYMENGVAGRRDSFTVGVDIDINGYIHVWISDLEHPRTEVRYHWYSNYE